MIFILINILSFFSEGQVNYKWVVNLFGKELLLEISFCDYWFIIILHVIELTLVTPTSFTKRRGKNIRSDLLFFSWITTLFGETFCEFREILSREKFKITHFRITRRFENNSFFMTLIYSYFYYIYRITRRRRIRREHKNCHIFLLITMVCSIRKCLKQQQIILLNCTTDFLLKQGLSFFSSVDELYTNLICPG